MKNGSYKTRKEQIEKGFLPALIAGLKAAGCVISPKGRKLIKEELRYAAMIGAAEERSRILGMSVSGHAQITERSIMSVLGYLEK